MRPATCRLETRCPESRLMRWARMARFFDARAVLDTDWACIHCRERFSGTPFASAESRLLISLASCAAANAPPPKSGNSPRYSAPSASTASRKRLVMSFLLLEWRPQFKILVLKDEANGPLIRLMAEAPQKAHDVRRMPNCAFFIRIAVHDHRSIPNQCSPSFPVFPHAKASRKSRGTVKVLSECAQGLFDPIALLPERSLLAINARDEQYQQRCLRLCRGEAFRPRRGHASPRANRWANK